MEEYILPMIVGLLMVVMGMVNVKGNISTLHWYHRQRVSEADRLPFGRLVGTGTILIGTALILFGGLSYAADSLQNPIYETIGTGIMIVSFVVGLGLSFYAMMKYNKEDAVMRMKNIKAL